MVLNFGYVEIHMDPDGVRMDILELKGVIMIME
jgi:hypothetical protein